MTKPEVLKTLSERDITRLRAIKTLKGHVPGRPQESMLTRKQESNIPSLSGSERTQFHKYRNIAKKEISDLTLMAECFPEKQRAQVFNKDMLEKLVEAILYSYEKSDKNEYVENVRIYKIANMVINKSGQAVSKGLIKNPYTSMFIEAARNETIDFVRHIQLFSPFIK